MRVLKRITAIFLMLLLPISVAAQQRDSYFDDYDAYVRFVDDRVMNRDFIDLIQVLGGRDEYTTQELNGLQGRFVSIYDVDFTGKATVKVTDLGNGFFQEMRIYWSENGNYIYFYAMLHDRPDALVVLTFTINSDVGKILAKF